MTARGNTAKKRKSRAGTGNTGTKGNKGKPTRGSRVAKIVEQQEAAINSFAAFMRKAAERSLKGDFNPSQLLKDYAELWEDWAGQFATITREILRD